MVLDTNVLTRATPASIGGPAWELLQYAAVSPHVLISSQPLILELADVLQRPRIRERHDLSDEEVAHFITSITQVAAMTSITQVAAMISLPAMPPAIVPDDPKGNAVLYTAVLGRADTICTRDRHFLNDAVRSYCSARGIKIMDDVELLKLLRRDHVP